MTIDISKLKNLKNKDEQQAENVLVGSKEVNLKMETEKYVAKFTEKNVEMIKGIVQKMKEMSKEDVKKEDVAKLADELEAAISVTEATEKPKEDVPEEKTEEPAAEEVKAEEPKAEEPVEEEKLEEVKEDVAAEETTEKSDDEEATEEDTSKHSDIGKAYEEVASQAVSKLKEIEKLYQHQKDQNEILTRENLTLKETVSKFNQDKHVKLVDTTVSEISKFKELSEEELNSKKDELSKMSDEALDIMKAEFEKVNLSKMESEQLFETTPSQELDGKNVSKNSEQKKDSRVNDLMRHLKYM